MDEQRVDRIARLLDKPETRRAALMGITAGLLGAGTTGSAATT